MVNVGIIKNAHLACFEIESVDGTDPADTRLRWPGHVTSLGTPVTEDHKHREFNPVGTQTRNPFFVAKTGESFEFEIQSLITEPFSVYGTSELLSKCFGTVDGSTGAVTFSEPLSTFTFEYGFDDGTITQYWVLTGCKINTVSISARPDDLLTLTIRGIGRILDGDNTAPVVCSNISMDDLQNIKFVSHGAVTGGPFQAGETVTGGTSGATGTVTVVGTNYLEYLKVSGDAVSGEVLTGGTSGATATTSVVPMPAHRKPPAHFKDVTWTWAQGDGTSFTTTPQVREFDWTVENNLEEIKTDNQQFFASCLAEGRQRITWTVKYIFEDIEKLTIFRAEPAVEAGQLQLQFVIDHDWTHGETIQGFYMDVDMGIGNSPVHNVLADHENAHSQDTVFLEESYSGMVVGDPTVDMSP